MIAQPSSPSLQQVEEDQVNLTEADKKKHAGKSSDQTGYQDKSQNFLSP